MSGRFLGTFLLDRGVITAEQLDEAIQVQRESNVLLGVLSLREGYLKPAQLEDLLESQQKANRKFGEFAREKGYLTEEQLSALLKLQAENHVLLGQALLRKGYLTEAALLRHLREFENASRANEEDISRRLAETPDAKILPTVLDTARLFFSRMGYLTRVEDVQQELPALKDYAVFAAEQHFHDHEDRYFGLLLSDQMMSLLARSRRLPRARVPDLGREVSYEIVSEMVYNLNYVICEEIRRTGHRVRHGAIQSVLPKTSGLSAVLLQTIAGSFWLLYLHV